MISRDEPVRDAGAAVAGSSLAHQPAEQQRYAALLELLARIGLAVRNPA